MEEKQPLTAPVPQPQPDASRQPAPQQAPVTALPGPQPAVQNPAGKPTLHISDEDAKALLAIHGLQPTQVHKGPRLPMSLMIALGALIAVVILASYLLGSLKPGSTPGLTPTQSGGAGSNSKSSASGNNITQKINQDVSSCSNPTVAISQC